MTPPSHVRLVSLDEVLRDSDVVSLHVPQTPTTTHLVGPAAVATMAVAVATGVVEHLKGFRS